MAGEPGTVVIVGVAKLDPKNVAVPIVATTVVAGVVTASLVGTHVVLAVPVVPVVPELGVVVDVNPVAG